MFIGENHPGKVQDPFVHCYVVEGNQFETVSQALLNATEPLFLREISLELSLEEAIGLFKRFSVNLSWKGMELNGREFVTSN